MEERYYLSKNRNRSGVHEVHREDCFYLPIEMNRIYLGLFSDSIEAVDVGREILSSVEECMKCLGESEKNKDIDREKSVLSKNRLNVLLKLNEKGL